MTEGPYYPDKLPLDTDNDLIIIKDSTTPAVGEITHLTGRVLTAPAINSHNTFDAPETIHPVAFTGTSDGNGKVEFKLPAKSVAVIAFE